METKKDREKEYMNHLLADYGKIEAHKFYELYGLNGMLQAFAIIKLKDNEIRRSYSKFFIEKTTISVELRKDIKYATKENNKILRGISDIKIIFFITYLTIIVLTIVALKK